MGRRDVRQWRPVVKQVLESKANELQLLGYAQATNEDIWNCLEERVWKGNPEKRLYEVVQDIFHLKSNIYMSYLTVNAYQDDDLMESIAALTNESSQALD